MKRRMDVAQISQGLSYIVYSTMLPNFFAFGFSILVFGTTIIHQQLVAMLRGHLRFVKALLLPRHSENCPTVLSKTTFSRLRYSPCIMCVQYRGDAQYRAGFSVPWGIS